jgi:hypothetical protein
MKNMIEEDFNIEEQGPPRKHLGVEYTHKKNKYGESWEVQTQSHQCIIDYLHLLKL